MTAKINFTKRALERLPLPAPGERQVYYDEYQHNLMLRISHTGNKVFYVRRKVNGTGERIQLGRFPDMAIEQARKKASTILSEIAEGRHPKQAARTTIEQLLTGLLPRQARVVFNLPVHKRFRQATYLHTGRPEFPRIKLAGVEAVVSVSERERKYEICELLADLFATITHDNQNRVDRAKRVRKEVAITGEEESGQSG